MSMLVKSFKLDENIVKVRTSKYKRYLRPQPLILQNGETNSSKLSGKASKSFEGVDHFVRSDLKRLKHRNVSNIFFLYYLSLFSCILDKPFRFRYFFDTHAFKTEADNFARVILTHYQVVVCFIHLTYAPSII